MNIPSVDIDRRKTVAEVLRLMVAGNLRLALVGQGTLGHPRQAAVVVGLEIDNLLEVVGPVATEGLPQGLRPTVVGLVQGMVVEEDSWQHNFDLLGIPVDNIEVVGEGIQLAVVVGMLVVGRSVLGHMLDTQVVVAW